MGALEESAQSATRRPIPVPYAAALAGQVAVLCGLGALFVYLLLTARAGSGAWESPIALLVPFSATAVFVVVVAGTVLHAVLTVLRLTSRWFYVAGMLLIVGACFPQDLATAARQPFDSLAFLIPVAAIPSGLFFHYAIHSARSTAPVDHWDALIVGTWIAAWFLSYLVNGELRFSIDEQYTPHRVLRVAGAQGAGIFMLGGIAAGFIRIWRLRVGGLVAAVSWLVPISFVAAYVATSLAAGMIQVSAGERIFEIDWRLSPRREADGFSFDARAEGPFEIAGAKQINRRLYISTQNGALRPGKREIEITSLRSNAFGLLCEAEQSVRDKSQICISRDDSGRVTTLIECWGGFCYLRFDHSGLRYGLHIDPGDVTNWKEIQRRSIDLLAVINTVHPLTRQRNS